MKKFIYFITLFIFFSIVSCVSTVDEGTEKAELPQFEVTSLHLYDSTMNVSEDELAKVLDELNAVIAEIGFPGAGYSLWKAQDDSLMQNRFMILSRWPDKTAYDSIHNCEAYNSFHEENKEFFESVRKRSLYHRYDLVK